jgi:hypothetical protein
MSSSRNLKVLLAPIRRRVSCVTGGLGDLTTSTWVTTDRLIAWLPAWWLPSHKRDKGRE